MTNLFQAGYSQGTADVKNGTPVRLMHGRPATYSDGYYKAFADAEKQAKRTKKAGA